jgi:hypothetical protein
MAVSPDVGENIGKHHQSSQNTYTAFQIHGSEDRFGKTRGTYCDLFQKELLELAIKR